MDGWERGKKKGKTNGTWDSNKKKVVSEMGGEKVGFEHKPPRDKTRSYTKYRVEKRLNLKTLDKF